MAKAKATPSDAKVLAVETLPTPKQMYEFSSQILQGVITRERMQDFLRPSKAYTPFFSEQGAPIQAAIGWDIVVWRLDGCLGFLKDCGSTRIFFRAPDGTKGDDKFHGSIFKGRHEFQFMFILFFATHLLGFTFDVVEDSDLHLRVRLKAKLT